ncbi:MAG: nitroreductase family protein [Candidatus Hydrogenedentes bacterium]|nr:nitroreductase family protein [Candidatus Hydrogenedentota bacterium]
MLHAFRCLPLAMRNGDLYRCYIYDFKRFSRFSAASSPDPTQESLRSLITIDYHRLEKGLSLRDCRVGFGRPAAEDLLRNTKTYLAEYGGDVITEIALNVLREYARFNGGHGVDVAWLTGELDQISAPTPAGSEPQGGTYVLGRDELLAKSKRDLSDFFASRHSIRDFSDEDVDPKLIEQAVGMALSTPSVCNRQAWRVHLFSDREEMTRALELQNGNVGFRHQINKLIIITCDLRCFVKNDERNQSWIDGGMFSMSLIYALHSLGLGTCCLNWAVPPWNDEMLRALGAIPENEVVMMFLAVGHLPEEFKVAQSRRRAIVDVLTAH